MRQQRAAEVAVLRVTDNGPGIPAEDHERIFHVFRRSPSTATAAVTGKGVGLAVVKTVVANYEGRVWVQSAPGNGSTFYVALSVFSTEGPQERLDESAPRQEFASHTAG